MEGVLPSGAPVSARREGGTVVSGAEAACVLCHRRTGLGSYEGSVIVPPVIGQALFGKFRKAGDRAPRRTAGMKYLDFDFHTRPPYDEESLARALRSGVSTSGYAFRYLMPRYELDEAAMRSLIAYLRTLNASPSPGVEPPYVHFASVVAPGTEGPRRKIFLDTLRTCFDERSPTIRGTGSEHGHDNERAALETARLGVAKAIRVRGRRSSNRGMRRGRCLPCCRVSARISGSRCTNSAPAQAIPCLFPNTDVPGGGEDFYNFYLSRGVILDAQVLGRYLIDEAGRLGIRRVVQVAGPGRAEAVSATTLREALAPSSLVLEDRPIPGPAGNSEQPARHGFEDLGASDALVLWLREPDLAAFAARLKAPPGGGSVFVSGRLVEPERVPLKEEWRAAARLIYPYDPPGRWALRSGFNLEPVAEQAQAAGDGRTPPGKHRHRLRPAVGEPGAHPGSAVAGLPRGNHRVPGGSQQRARHLSLSPLHSRPVTAHRVQGRIHRAAGRRRVRRIVARQRLDRTVSRRGKRPVAGVRHALELGTWK